MIILLINYHSGHNLVNIINESLNSGVIRSIIVVNNSYDDFVMDDIFYDDRVIPLSALENLGYSGGNNLAFHVAGVNGIKDDICIINGDITCDSKVFRVCKQAMANDDSCGQIGVSTVGHGGKHLYSAIKMRGMRQEFAPRGDFPLVDSDYVAGSFLLIRCEALIEADYIFDDKFFMYWEEVDLSFRLRSAGWSTKVITDYDISREHNSHSSIVASFYYQSRNSFLIYRRWNFRALSLMVLLLVYFSQSLLWCFKTASLTPMINVMQGVLHGLRGNYGRRGR